jgi:hypothetical protein
MIKVINIMPKEYLYKFHINNNKLPHMAMAHLILKDRRYAEWVKQQRDEGMYVILDNSAPYFSEGIDDISLLKCINKINPNEVVLPDVINNFNKTINRSLNFLNKIKESSKLKIMAVPQGKDTNEYIKCYKIFSEEKRISTIGISYTVDVFFSKPKKEYISKREYLINILNKKNRINLSKNHHLLGFGDSAQIELKRMRKFNFIKSCDSNAAYITSKNNLKIIKNVPYKKPKDKINFDEKLNNRIYKLMLHNIKILCKEGGNKCKDLL